MFALYLLGLVEVNVYLQDRVDLIEINHFGPAVVEQCAVIYWEWNLDHYRVVDWRWYRQSGQRPVRSHRRYIARWRDGDDLREVQALQFRETWTQYDVEVHDRRCWPEEKRRLLTSPSCSFKFPP